MKILFVASENTPFNHKTGAEQRSSLLLQACKNVGEVDVISFCEDYVEDDAGCNVLFSKLYKTSSFQIDSRRTKIELLLSSFCAKHITWIDREREAVIDGFVNSNIYDYIIVRYSFAAVNCGLLKYADRLIIDVDDDTVNKLSIIKKTAKTFRTKIFYYIYANNVRFAMKHFERLPHKILYSRQENVKNSNSVYLPNIPFYQRFSMISGDDICQYRLLFVGNMQYTPNIEAVDYFVHEVFPLLKKEFPNSSLHVVGKCCKREKDRWELVDGVKILGYVTSIEVEYAEANVVIMPMLQGAGTCIKFIEAIQMGRPIVASDEAFHGYESYFTPGIDFLLARSHEEYCLQISKLFKNKKMIQPMVSSAYEKLLSNFSLEKFFAIVSDCF